MSARVLFVTKAMAPPLFDGTKCLVRDIASHLQLFAPQVMGVSGHDPVPLARPEATSPFPIEVLPVYSSEGQFAPGLRQNLQAFRWLLTHRAADVWHFLFAPNPKSSMAGRWLRRVRRVPVLQTVASPPRSFDAPDKLLFGDIVVVQSRWTAQRLLDSFQKAGRTAPRIEVIPPSVFDVPRPSAGAALALRRELGIGETAPVFVYPGDLEVSQGAETMARLAAPLLERSPEAFLVFAYRSKTSRASEVAAQLEARLAHPRVRFVADRPDVLTLVSTSSVVLFPVDDLWGKVDLPIVLLEAMSLGVPVVTLDHGPLKDLASARRVPMSDDAGLLEAALGLAARDVRETQIAAQLAEVEQRYGAAKVAARYEALYGELYAERREPEPESESKQANTPDAGSSEGTSS